MNPAQLQRSLQEAVEHHRAGRLDQAAAIYQRIRAQQPGNFDATHLAGVIALQQGRAMESVALLERALQLSPRSHVCSMRLGVALISAGRAAAAEAPLRHATQLKPDFAEAWDNLAFCLKAQDKLPAAVECHERALALKPTHAPGWYNYGLTLSLLGRIRDALACHERALAADPAFKKAHYGRAQALQQAHRIEEAIAAYDEYLRHEPGHAEAQSYRLFALNNLAGFDCEKLFAEHVAFGRRLGGPAAPDFANAPDPARRLRLGILSPDLRAHSCAYYMEPLLRHLDPAHFELYLYHDHFRQDAVSERLKSLAAVWRNFVGQSGPAVEAAIRADAPDILVDLAGHTGMTNRLALFARHLAPVQINYLGYPNTTGVPAIGYRFTDAIADPPGEADAFATEKLVRFAPTAWAYQAPDRTPEVAPPPCAAIADAPVTFGCFNNLAKVTEDALAAWARILGAVPNSRLLLKGRDLGNEDACERYRQRLAAVGAPVDRVEFLANTPKTFEHLALYHRVDIALDTFPYNGTTTTCEALWMGRPVVSLRGDRHAARVGASLLTALGHPEWVATTVNDYVDIATGLADDRARLAIISAGLRAKLTASPLGDHAGQSARFAAALRACWLEWCAARRQLAANAA